MYPSIRITWVNHATGESIALDPEDSIAYCPYWTEAENLAYAKDFGDNVGGCRDIDVDVWRTVVELV